MKKYKKDKDKHLQRLRKALPKASFLGKSSQPLPNDRSGMENSGHGIRRSKKINGGLLKRITNLKPVKGDSTSLCRFTATIHGFIDNMEHIDCVVTNATEALCHVSATFKIRRKRQHTIRP